MKKTSYFFMTLLAAVVSLGFVSCGSDDDDTDFGGSSIDEAPVYDAYAAKYDITSSSSPYSSIELTGSGNYIITKNGTRAEKQQKKNIFIFARPNKKSTRSEEDSNFLFGTYTKDGDNFILDGFGTLSVVQSGSSAYALQITPETGDTYTLTGTKSETISSSSMTDKLCRTWKFVKFEEQERGPESDEVWSFSGTFEELYNTEGSEYSDIFTDVEVGVIITKSGTYFSYESYYCNGVKESDYYSGSWCWVNKSTGQLRFDDCYEDCYHTVTFSGNTAIFKNVEDDDDGYYESTIYAIAL